MNLWPVMDDVVVRLALLAMVIWVGRLDSRVKRLERDSNAQVKATGRLHHLMVAHERYMRLAVKDGSFWAAHQGSRVDVHERQLKRLDKVAHGHKEMNLENPKVTLYIDGKDMRPKPDKPRT